MVSNDEHREVAERLRFHDAMEPPMLELETCLGGKLMTDADTWSYLADLIDRPTCEMEFDTVHCDYVCSRCGQTYQYFETYDGDGHPVPFRHCPVCGSEVVEK